MYHQNTVDFYFAARITSQCGRGFCQMWEFDWLLVLTICYSTFLKEDFTEKNGQFHATLFEKLVISKN